MPKDMTIARIIREGKFFSSFDGRTYVTHKPRFSRVGKRSQFMRYFWVQKKLHNGHNAWHIGKTDIDKIEATLPEKEKRRRDRNRVNSGEQAILARVQKRQEARKMQKQEELEKEARFLNELSRVRADQKLTDKQRKMGIRPFARQIKI